MTSRRRGTAGPALPDEVQVVFVSGYGSALHGDFSELIGMMGLPTDQVEYFDYRWTRPGTDHQQAARLADVETLTVALQAYLAGLAESGQPIYLVGHSLGGVTLANLLASWDRNPWLRVPSVRGAAILEPPMSDGLLGVLQSFPRPFGIRPHDGGYDPVRGLGPLGQDSRVNLGRQNGVPLVVFRNPKALVTSFRDHPEGLRVFDVPDEGPAPWQMIPPIGPLALLVLPALVARVAEAHHSVLEHPGVARCILEEIDEGGSCLEVEPAGG